MKNYSNEEKAIMLHAMECYLSNLEMTVSIIDGKGELLHEIIEPLKELKEKFMKDSGITYQQPEL